MVNFGNNILIGVLNTPFGMNYNLPLYINLSKQSHVLISGSTNSGKTFFLKYLLSSLSHTHRDAELFINDFKGDTDFDIFDSFSSCFRYNKVDEGFNLFFDRFNARRSGVEKLRSPLILVFDEWNGWIISHDNKKMRDDTLNKMSMLLSMGRSFGCYVIISVQRADAKYFETSRDNFGNVIGLGRLSPESTRMLFPDNAGTLEPQQRGRGYFLKSGSDIEPLYVPDYSNDLRYHLINIAKMLKRTHVKPVVIE